MSQVEVAFCGQSLYISGLESGLRSCKQIRVVRLESDFSQIAEELKMLHPDVVVFELNPTNREWSIQDFLRTHPPIRLIGLNPDEETLTIFTGVMRRTVSVTELGRVILDEDFFQNENKEPKA